MAFRPCEFRRFDAEWICDAAGAPLRRLAEAGERLEDTCARCRIPEEMARRPCLFMVAVKVQREGKWEELFPCHWYHSISRDDVLHGTVLCGGCVDWFPRPPRKLIYRFPERTAAMRDTMRRRLMEPSGDWTGGQWRAPREPAPALAAPWWRRMVTWAAGWI